MEDHHTRYRGPTALLHRREPPPPSVGGTADLLSGFVGQFWHISPGNHSLGAAADDNWAALGGRGCVYLNSTQTDIDT